MSDRVREAIQELLNQLGDGWTVTQYVISMGLERMGSDSRVEATSWYYTPLEQADWQTLGLLRQAAEMHYESSFEDEDE